MKTFVLLVLVGVASAQLPPMMQAMVGQPNQLGGAYGGAMGGPDVCMAQCTQQCHSGLRVGAVLPGTMRHLRAHGQAAYLQGGMPGPMNGMASPMGAMGLMGANSPSMMTVSGGNRAIPVNGFSGMAGAPMGAMNSLAGMSSMGLQSDGLMGTHVTETVKTVQPVGQISVKG